MEEITQYMFKSKVGKIYLEATSQGLCGCNLSKQKSKIVVSLTQGNASHKFLAQAEKEIKEYINGERTKFSVKLDMSGTPFQKKVWNQLLKIPFGKSASYKEIAKLIKNPKAVRAVGSANGKNNICIIIPCHRVIAADGTLGGYSGGLVFKRKLLQIEKITYTE